MHAKYEVSISYGSKVIAKVKVDNRQTNRQTDRQTNRQTGQKQYAPDHSIRGHNYVIRIIMFYIFNGVFNHFKIGYVVEISLKVQLGYFLQVKYTQTCVNRPKFMYIAVLIPRLLVKEITSNCGNNNLLSKSFILRYRYHSKL